MKHIRLNVEVLDHLLMAVGSMLAVYAGAISIQKVEVARYFMVAVAVGSVIGLALRSAFGSKQIVTWDGIFYTLAATATFAFAPQLNRMLPEGGYPFQIIATGVFSWMLVFGSVFSWRDQTLTFQVVPGLSILGLAGAYDLKESPLYFFIFLLCAASLFFRAHARSMAAQAEQALLAGHHAKNQAERDVVVKRAIDSGAWKWMAGPEWALGSALAIVLLSLIGAPLIQKSVQGVTSIVQVTLPRITPSPASQATRFTGASTQIGRGPATFRNIPVLRAGMPEPGLLRGRTMETYHGSGWSNQSAFAPHGTVRGRYWLGSPNAFFRAADVAPAGRPIGFNVTILSGLHGQIYVPGEPVNLVSEHLGFSVGIDGAILTSNTLGVGTTYHGDALVVDREPTNERSSEPPNVQTAGLFYDVSRIPSRVMALAREVSNRGTTDYEKALLIKAEIEQRCVYNLRAPAVPSNEDAVDYFLFESREGYCDLFASSMALMARSAGLAARVCTGFIAAQPDDESGHYIARDSDAHMWAEIYFKGIGWVKFDATEGAAIVNARDSTPSSLLTKETLEKLVDGALVLCAAAIVVIGVWSVFRRRPRSTAPQRTASGRLYEAFQRSVERRTGKPRRFSQTPREYIHRVETELGPLGPEASDLTTSFERALYAPVEPTEEELHQLSSRVRAFRKAPKSRP